MSIAWFPLSPDDQLFADNSVSSINVTLAGNAGRDVLEFFNGDSSLAYQGSGAQLGGNGNDSLISGRGNDVLAGETGKALRLMCEGGLVS